MNIRLSALFSLEGRIGRRTFWILAGPFFLLMTIMAVMSFRQAPDVLEAWDTFYFFTFGVSLVFALFGVRRLHDRGISGKWMSIVVAPFILAYIPPFFPLIYLYPFVMLVMFVIVAFMPGHEGENRYGAPGSGSPFAGERTMPDVARLGDQR